MLHYYSARAAGMSHPAIGLRGLPARLPKWNVAGAAA